MLLNLCKSCSHYICIMKDKVYCGYKIDREERNLSKTKGAEPQVLGCPKEKK